MGLLGATTTSVILTDNSPRVQSLLEPHRPVVFAVFDHDHGDVPTESVRSWELEMRGPLNGSTQDSGAATVTEVRLGTRVSRDFNRSNVDIL